MPVDPDLRVSSVGEKAFEMEFYSRVDPTSGSVGFAVKADATTPTVFVSGAIDSWNPTTKRAKSTTPTIGSSSAGIDITSLANGSLTLWYRIVVGAERDALPWDGGKLRKVA